MRNIKILAVESIVDSVIDADTQSKSVEDSLANDKVIQDDSESKTIQMSGPLSQIYTHALNIVYVKNDEKDNYLVTESMANDTYMAQALHMALTHSKTNYNELLEGDNESTFNPSDIHVFATGYNDINDDVVDELVNEMSMINNSNKKAEKIVIVDSDNSLSEVQSQVSPEYTPDPTQVRRFDSVVEAFKIKRFDSLESFIKYLRK